MINKPVILSQTLPCRRLLWAVGMFCALVFLPFGNAQAETSPKPDAGFQRQLIDRAEKYLESIHRYAADLPDADRRRLEKQAHHVVESGFARLKTLSHLARTRAFEPFEPAWTLHHLGDRIDRSAIQRVFAFLNQNFHQPSELEVAVRIALPSRFEWARRFGILARHRHGSNPFSDTDGMAFIFHDGAVVSSTTPRDVKTWLLLLGTSQVPIQQIDTESAVRRLEKNDDHLHGFHLIVQTAVLRQ